MMKSTRSVAMLLFGNKQMRAEEKIFGELSKKIKDSRTITGKTVRNSEIFYLDSIDIEFSINLKKLIVSDKAGNQIVSMECDWVGDYEDMAAVKQARFYRFSKLLEIARNRYNKEVEKSEKTQQMRRAEQKVKTANDTKTEQQRAEAATLAALQKIKSL